MPLPLPLDVASLTMGLVNIGSATGQEAPIADSVEQALGTQPHLGVERIGNTVVARTDLGCAERVLLVGHLDTVPADDNELAYVEMGKLFGLGACDMKGGLAVMLKAASLPAYGRDVSLVFYDGQETVKGANGLDVLTDKRPDLLRADRAVVLEPTDARVDSTAADGTAAARLTALGVPAVTFGPGDPRLAHTREEYVPTAQLTECEHRIRELLAGRATL